MSIYYVLHLLGNDINRKRRRHVRWRAYFGGEGEACTIDFAGLGGSHKWHGNHDAWKHGIGVAGDGLYDFNEFPPDQPVLFPHVTCLISTRLCSVALKDTGGFCATKRVVNEQPMLIIPQLIKLYCSMNILVNLALGDHTRVNDNSISSRTTRCLTWEVFSGLPGHVF